MHLGKNFAKLRKLFAEPESLRDTDFVYQMKCCTAGNLIPVLGEIRRHLHLFEDVLYFYVSLAPIVGTLLFGSACFHPWWVLFFLFFFHLHPELFRGPPPHVPSNFGPEYPPGVYFSEHVPGYAPGIAGGSPGSCFESFVRFS